MTRIRISLSLWHLLLAPNIMCIGWAAVVTNPNHRFDLKAVDKAPPMLLVNSIYDSSTSFVWANSVRSQTPKSGLVVRDGFGHTSYTLYGKTSAAIDRFLSAEKLPAHRTTFNS
jgi:hypothetical protein